MVATPGAADQVRDSQWVLRSFDVENKVWPQSQGEGVVVAVVDSGVMQDHQDLTGQVLPGTDFSGAKTDGRVDNLGHGTGIASLIAGHGHGDRSGVMGLAPKAKILPVRIRTNGESPNLDQSDIALAVRYATDKGAKVINMSLGGYSRLDSQARDAIKYAVSKDVVLVAASGNGDSNSVEYPAAFPGVVAVTAVDEQGKLWAKATPGPETTLAAPGVEIYHSSAKSTSSYGIGQGTSDGVAYVSATAALIRAKYPNLSAGQVVNRMIKTATPPADGSVVPGDRYGYGVLAPAKALEANPAVDNGPRENPLVGRKESQGAPPVDEPTDGASEEAVSPGADGGGNGGNGVGVVVGVAAGGLVLVVALVGVLVVRRRRGAGQ
ncbi:type VII secretion-associated serine protease mycosin [Kitasatospora xanthocidica]|uniref:Type VII secretion-associated serine protease mycosin n=2 Tax=Kitasatospora xanthocidica TaxID=83382 RepID=A0A372ZWM6_9ACTN|nr:type VII secretion-associated serine protease mycosin [Kitasatospora xanthocidica]